MCPDMELIGNVKNDRFARYLGIKLLEAKYGYAKAEMEITENHLNGLDILHGGAIFALADYAFAAASNSKNITVGINVNITYFRSPRGRKIFAEASEISTQNKTCGYKVDIYDEDGELIAHLSALGYMMQNRGN